MHDKTKEQLLQENEGNKQKQDFIELVSTPGYEFLPNITENRFIKTHMPFSLLPPSVMECESKVSDNNCVFISLCETIRQKTILLL